jgi:hypothetical protein
MTRHYTPGTLIPVGVRLSLVLVGSLTAAAVNGYTNRGQAYSVATLVRQLEQHPHVWAGRTVYVKGVVTAALSYTPGSTGCGQSPVCRKVQATWWLVDVEAPSSETGLLLQWGAPDSFRALLRRAPLLGQSAPTPALLLPDTVAIYRIQLRLLPRSTCPACYAAVLLDAAP